MKTIEEASGDYTHKNYGKRKVDAYIHEAFKSGVEFAQRWISVEEELPEEFTTVLVKNELSTIRSIALFRDKIFYADFILEHEDITHWRPIEYK